MADTSRLPEPNVDYWNWQLAAACRGMDSSTFFHPPEERNLARKQRIEQAKAICRACPAITECLAHALRVQEPYGIWGGQSEDERAALLGVESLRYPKKNPALAESYVQ
ncbi:MAG: WhiB family transcriptional regulator [Nakamurella sp.]